MKNLAGVLECDDFIRIELEKARIQIVQGERVDHEVAYSITGQLGNFHFRRAWYYWVATGPVPLAIAKELYADPIGKTDIRVAGHCACPPPEEWIDYIDADGYTLVPQNQYDDFLKCFHDDFRIREIMEEQKSRFSDNLERDGKAYVTSYHIDTQEGLRLFADLINPVDVRR